jgi:hypothetical protein
LLKHLSHEQEKKKKWKQRIDMMEAQLKNK